LIQAAPSLSDRVEDDADLGISIAHHLRGERCRSHQLVDWH